MKKVNNIKFEEVAPDFVICKTPYWHYHIYMADDGFDVYFDDKFEGVFTTLHDAKTFVIQDLIRRYNELHSFLYEQKEVTS